MARRKERLQWGVEARAKLCRGRITGSSQNRFRSVWLLVIMLQERGVFKNTSKLVVIKLTRITKGFNTCFNFAIRCISKRDLAASQRPRETKNMDDFHPTTYTDA